MCPHLFVVVRGVQGASTEHNSTTTRQFDQERTVILHAAHSNYRYVLPVRVGIYQSQMAPLAPEAQAPTAPSGIQALSERKASLCLSHLDSPDSPPPHSAHATFSAELARGGCA